jgi:hypothetical protein
MYSVLESKSQIRNKIKGIYLLPRKQMLSIIIMLRDMNVFCNKLYIFQLTQL